MELKFAMVAGYKADGTRKIIPQFEQLTGAKVVQDDLPYAQLHEKLALTLSGKTNAYDVFFCDEGYVPQLAGYFYPLDSLITRDKAEIDSADIVPSTMAAGQWKGKQASMPMDSNVTMFFYRKDVLQAKGIKPPETWADIMKVGKQLVDPTKDFFGWAESGKRAAQTGFRLMMIIWSFGPKIIDDKFGVDLDSDQGLQGLELYKELFSISPLGSKGYEQPEIMTAFQEGRVAMSTNWASTALSYEDPKVSKVVGKIGYGLYPSAVTRSPMRGVWTMAMPGSIDKAKLEGAWAFIKWMTGKEGGLQYALAGSGHPCRITMLTDPKFKAKFPYADIHLAGLKIARVRPFLPETAEIMAEFEIMGSSVASEAARPKEALKQAADNIRGILKRAGYVK
jgi:multiple sugar transport system substrate-binding protein